MLLNTRSLFGSYRAQVNKLENEIRSVQESKEEELSALRIENAELRFVMKWSIL